MGQGFEEAPRHSQESAEWNRADLRDLKLSQRREVAVETDIPLTDVFECPYCGFRGLFNTEPCARVKCQCGTVWILEYHRYRWQLSPEEKEQIKTWEVTLYKGYWKIDDRWFEGQRQSLDRRS